tara:strand:- start:2086 stop:3012 length:927 start_codon:yes stop_codon:yes gene_type:complete
MHRYNQTPNLLLIGGPKTGTTSLMKWLSSHDSIYHPWPNESHFLMAGVSEFPTAPIYSKGTIIVAPEPSFNNYKNEAWILDKSAFHLYSERALRTVKENISEAKIIITLRNPIDLMLSMHQEHSKRLVEYNTSQEDMLNKAKNINFKADINDPETWSFLGFPRMKSSTLKWVENFGDRVRIVPLDSIKNDSLATMNDILSWLKLETLSENTDLPRKNEGGSMNPAKWAKFLRKPPNFIVNLVKILMPSQKLRKMFFDPLRKPGFNPKKTSRPELDEEMRNLLEIAFEEEIEFLENLESYINSELLIIH